MFDNGLRKIHGEMQLSRVWLREAGEDDCVHRYPVFFLVFSQSLGKTKQKPEIVLLLQNET